MKQAKSRKKGQTIFTKLFFPLFFLLIIQSLIFILVIFRGGIVSQLQNYAYDVMEERVINRRTELGNRVMQWMNLSSAVDSYQMAYKEFLRRNDRQNVFGEDELQKSFLSDTADILEGMITQNVVNGAFFIWNQSQDYHPLEKDESVSRIGLCIRDLDLDSTARKNGDLLVERAPASLISSLGYIMDSWWESAYKFSYGKNNDYYYEPLKAAVENPDADYQNLGYFCAPHYISDNDTEVISYSVPLIDENGVCYAILGVELSTEYIASLIPGEELGGQNIGAYVFVQKLEEDQYCTYAYNGVLYQRIFDTSDVIDVSGKEENGHYHFLTKNNEMISGTMSKLNVYNHNTPFEEHELALIGILPEDNLLQYSKEISQKLLITAISSLLIGITGLWLISKRFTKPIIRLSEKVEHTNPKETTSLEHLGIREVDQLIDSIAHLSKALSDGQAQTEFFSRMSHDMRTPMNAIIGFSSPELLEGTDEKEKQENLERIHSSGKYLLGLINEVLDISKIDSHKLVINAKPEALISPWKEIEPMIEELSEEKKIILKENIQDECLDCRVCLDSQRIQQIFMNLLSNAIKFTPPAGTVTFSASIQKREEDRIWMEYIVSDTGIGMSDEFKKKLFVAFSQENPGKEGTGLGLVISKNLIELMGGTISCKSHKNFGTSFNVVIPFQYLGKESELANDLDVRDAGLASAETDKKQENEKGKRSLEGKKVLLCEDHPMNTMIAVGLLERKKMIVTCAENGAIGLELFKNSAEGTYDVVLMDIRMPVLNGLETARAIRQLDREDAKHIPIIAMTANAFEEDMKQSREAGMNAHLAKPIEPEKLYQTLIEKL